MCRQESSSTIFPLFIYLLLTSLYIPGCNFYKSGMLQNSLRMSNNNIFITMNTVGGQWVISIVRQTCQKDSMLLLVTLVKICEKVLMASCHWRITCKLIMNTFILTFP